MQVAIDINGTIAMIIESDTLEIAQQLFPQGTAIEAADHSGLERGWVSDGNGSYEAPPLPPAPPVVVNQIEFKRLMTQAERIAVRAAAQNSPEIYDFNDLLNSAINLQMDDPDVVAGINQLETAGILATGRAAQILSGTPPA